MRTTKAYKFVSLAVVAGLLSIGFSSCTGKSDKKSASRATEETIKKEIEEYAYPLPSAFEVTNMLNEIEASYIAGISNDPGKADSYFSDKNKAENLGVYSADLAYATTYNQKPEVQSFFKACETLVRGLDFTAAFDENLPDRIEATLDNKDSLVNIVTNMFDSAYSYLNKQGRTEVSYLVLTGTVVEGLYLTTHISENTFQNPKLIQAILFQKEPLQKLQGMMEKFKDSDMTKDAYQNIAKINGIYALEEGNTSMTEAQVEKLTETLTEIRNNIVK